MALGALVALLPLPALRRRTAAILCAAGLGAIAVGTFGFDVLTPYPGITALVPAVGAALVIAAGGRNGDAAAPSRMLGVAPLRFMGRMSYSWYLWHWPALVFGGVVLGALTLTERVALIALSFVPAVLTHRYVEEPFRRAKSLKLYPRRAFAVGVASTATALVAVVAMLAAQGSTPSLPGDRVEGAAAIARGDGTQKFARALAPTPVNAAADRSAMQRDGCLLSLEETRSAGCVYGDADSETTVVLFGDSLAQHYSPALERLAERRGWRLVGLTKMGCSPAEVTVYSDRLEREYRECDVWRAEALERIEREEDPELVLVSGRVSTPVMEDGEVLDEQVGSARMEEGYVDVLERLRDASPNVAVMKDLPRSPKNVPDCVADAMDNLDACAFRPDPDRYAAPDNRAASRVRGVKLIDMTPLVCPDGVCRSVIGDALVFRDYDHLTPTFAATLAPMIERRLPGIS